MAHAFHSLLFRHKFNGFEIRYERYEHNSATAAQISIAIVSFNKIPTSNCAARIVLTIKRLTFRVRVMPFSSLLLIFSFVHSLARLTLDMIFNFLISFTFNFMFLFLRFYLQLCFFFMLNFCLTKIQKKNKFLNLEIQCIDIHYIEIYLRCNFISIFDITFNFVYY